ncbi:MAG: PIN domain nuclease [Verrucomicrobia bacterium]|nr:PIN domain nuclease [Verrucomicrobiota bacterium]
MVLADTSVWIDYFNGVVNWQTDRLDWLLGAQPVALGDLILTEVLQGFDREVDFQRAGSVLSTLPFYELGGYQLCLQSANNYRTLRHRGISVRKTIDVIIATGCVEWNLELLHNDRDFTLMEQVLGLKVVKRT